MTGGDVVSTYLPDYGVREVLKDNRETPVWKLRFVLSAAQLALIGRAVISFACPCRYTSNGGLLYSVGEDGILRRYRRFPDRHQYLGPVYKHRLEVQDLDISPFDECE